MSATDTATPDTATADLATRLQAVVSSTEITAYRDVIRSASARSSGVRTSVTGPPLPSRGRRSR